MQVVKEIKNKTEYDIQVEDIIYSLYFKIQVKIFFGRAREIREYALYNNIVRTIARNSNSELVYFGQFGTSHLHQAYVEYKNMLTHLLGSIQYKNINATMLLYKNCQQIIYKNASWSKSDKNLNNIFQKALFNEDISSKDLILGKDMKSAISLFLDEAFIHKDYINNYINQYVIIKDSRSSTML